MGGSFHVRLLWVALIYRAKSMATAAFALRCSCLGMPIRTMFLVLSMAGIHSTPAARDGRPDGLHRSRIFRRETELPLDNVSFVCREQRLPPSPSTIVVGETSMTLKDRARSLAKIRLNCPAS